MSNALTPAGAGRPEMRTSTHRRLSITTGEHLLDGAPGSTPLHRLLAAAAGPATADELSGAAAAHAVFVTADRSRPLPDESPRSDPMSTLILSKLLAAKALVAIVLVGGATGVGLAATATDEPTDQRPATASERAVPGGPADATAADADVEADALAADHAPAAVAEPEDGAAPARRATPAPDPSLRGLCRAWAAGATDNPGRAAENPAFSALIAAAGSADAVPSFCADLSQPEPVADDAQDATVPAEDPAPTGPGASAGAPGHTDAHAPPRAPAATEEKGKP